MQRASEDEVMLVQVARAIHVLYAAQLAQLVYGTH